MRPYRSTVRSLATTVAAAPSVMPGALPAVTVPLGRVAAILAVGQGEDRLESGQGLDRRVPPGTLVDGHDGLAALRVAHGDRRDLGLEPTFVDRRDRALVAAQRELVLVLAADLVGDRDALGMGAHVAPLDGAPQPVVDRRVDQRPVAQAIAEAGPGQEVRRAVHALHPARDDHVGVAGPDLGRPEHDGLERRAADPVDGRRARRDRQPATEGRLAGRCLAGAGLEHLAHEDLVDRDVGRQAAPLDRRPDGDPTELDRRHVGQRAAELADRRPGGADEIDAAVAAGVGRVSHRGVSSGSVGLARIGRPPTGRRSRCTARRRSRSPGR